MSASFQAGSIASSKLVYIGERIKEGNVIYTLDERNGERHQLTHVMRHSPSGMEWGYAGSGPADLAHSILCHYLEMESVSPQLYHHFKHEVVARFPEDRWRLTRNYVENWLGKRWAHMTEDQVREDLRG